MTSKLTKDMLHELYYYKEGKLYWKVKKCNRVNIDDEVGCLSSTGYYVARVLGTLHKVHRLIYLMHHGNLPRYVDHINGVRTDNRIENLRPATKSENQFNCKTYKSNTSGIKGVCWHKDKQKWRVELAFNNKRKSFGYFDDIELAELVIKEARDKYHKEYARYE